MEGVDVTMLTGVFLSHPYTECQQAVLVFLGEGGMNKPWVAFAVALVVLTFYFGGWLGWVLLGSIVAGALWERSAPVVK